MECPLCKQYKDLINSIFSTISDFRMYGDDYSIDPEFNGWNEDLKKIEGEINGVPTVPQPANGQ
jgi:hypothetical protein